MVEYRLWTLCSLVMLYNMFILKNTYIPSSLATMVPKRSNRKPLGRSRKLVMKEAMVKMRENCSSWPLQSETHAHTHTQAVRKLSVWTGVCVCAWDMYLYCKLYCEFPPKNATFENVLQTERWGISDTDLGIAFHWPRGCWHTGSWSSLLSSGRTPGRPSRTRPLQNKGTPAALWPGSATSAALPLPHTRAWSRNAHTHTHSTRYFTLSLFKLPWWSLHWREKTRKRENQDWENKK